MRWRNAALALALASSGALNGCLFRKKNVPPPPPPPLPAPVQPAPPDPMPPPRVEPPPAELPDGAAGAAARSFCGTDIR